MTTCSFDRELLTLHCFGDLSAAEARRVEEHVASCASCAAERAGIESTLRRLEPSALYPREGEVDWDRFAEAAVSRALGGARVLTFRARLRRLVPATALARAAMLLVAVGLGVLLWTQWPEGPGGEDMGLPGGDAVQVMVTENMQDRLEVAVARRSARDYLEESRVVLVNVLDAPIRCSKDQIDIEAERKKSIELLRVKKRLQGDLERPELARAAELCDQLEGILTEISTLEGCTDLQRIRELRAAVQRHQLLTKIGVVGNALGDSLA